MRLATLPSELRLNIVGNVLGAPSVDRLGYTRHVMHPLRRLMQAQLPAQTSILAECTKQNTPAELDYMAMSLTCKGLRESCLYFARQVQVHEVVADCVPSGDGSWTATEVNIKSSLEPVHHGRSVVVCLSASIEVFSRLENDHKVMVTVPPSLKTLAASWHNLHALALSSPQALIWLPSIVETLPRGRAQLTEIDARGILDLTKYERKWGQRGPGEVRITGTNSLFDEALEILPKCRQLKYLRLDGNPDVHRAELHGPNPRAFGALQRLHSLDKLEHLVVRHYPIVAGERRQEEEEQHLQFRNLPRRFPSWTVLPFALRSLTLEHVVHPVTTATRLIASASATLESVYLVDCALDFYVSGMHAMPFLKHLHIAWSGDDCHCDSPHHPRYRINRTSSRLHQLQRFTSPVLRTLSIDTVHLLDRSDIQDLTTYLSTDGGNTFISTLEKVKITGKCKSGAATAFEELKSKLLTSGVEVTFDL